MTSAGEDEGLGDGHQGDANDKRHLVETLGGGAGRAGVLGLVFEIAQGSGSVMTLATGVG